MSKNTGIPYGKLDEMPKGYLLWLRRHWCKHGKLLTRTCKDCGRVGEK